MGPELGDERVLRYEGLGVYADEDGRETTIDLVVWNESEYRPNAIDENGIRGKFGTINLANGFATSFMFCFAATGTYRPLKLPDVDVTFYDLDNGADGLREFLTVGEMASYTVPYESTQCSLVEGTNEDLPCQQGDLHDNYPCTELEVDASADDGTTTFMSTVRGFGCDNPSDPQDLTSLQLARLVQLHFQDQGCFSVRYESVTNNTARGGRNFLFAGTSLPTCFTNPSPPPTNPSAPPPPPPVVPPPRLPSPPALPPPCMPSHTAELSFETATLVANNLGGLGPELGDERVLRYEGLGVYADEDGRETTIDLVVWNESEYRPNAIDENGIRGKFGTINLANGFATSFMFCFAATGTYRPLKLPDVDVTFYDLDNGADGLREFLTVGEMASYTVPYESTQCSLVEGTNEDLPCQQGDLHDNYPCTELEVDASADDGTTTFMSTVRGFGCDNPSDPQDLTSLQLARLVQLHFQDQGCFSVRYESVTNNTARGGRNFLFAGASLPATCLSFPAVPPPSAPPPTPPPLPSQSPPAFPLPLSPPRPATLAMLPPTTPPPPAQPSLTISIVVTIETSLLNVSSVGALVAVTEDWLTNVSSGTVAQAELMVSEEVKVYLSFGSAGAYNFTELDAAFREVERIAEAAVCVGSLASCAASFELDGRDRRARSRRLDETVDGTLTICRVYSASSLDGNDADAPPAADALPTLLVAGILAAGVPGVASAEVQGADLVALELELLFQLLSGGVSSGQSAEELLDSSGAIISLTDTIQTQLELPAGGVVVVAQAHDASSPPSFPPPPPLDVPASPPQSAPVQAQQPSPPPPVGLLPALPLGFLPPPQPMPAPDVDQDLPPPHLPPMPTSASPPSMRVPRMPPPLPPSLPPSLRPLPPVSPAPVPPWWQLPLASQPPSRPPPPQRPSSLPPTTPPMPPPGLPSLQNGGIGDNVSINGGVGGLGKWWLLALAVGCALLCALLIGVGHLLVRLRNSKRRGVGTRTAGSSTPITTEHWPRGLHVQSKAAAEPSANQAALHRARHFLSRREELGAAGVVSIVEGEHAGSAPSAAEPFVAAVDVTPVREPPLRHLPMKPRAPVKAPQTPSPRSAAQLWLSQQEERLMQTPSAHEAAQLWLSQQEESVSEDADWADEAAEYSPTRPGSAPLAPPAPRPLARLRTPEEAPKPLRERAEKKIHRI